MRKRKRKLSQLLRTERSISSIFLHQFRRNVSHSETSLSKHYDCIIPSSFFSLRCVKYIRKRCKVSPEVRSLNVWAGLVSSVSLQSYFYSLQLCSISGTCIFKTFWKLIISLLIHFKRHQYKHLLLGRLESGATDTFHTLHSATVL